MNTNKPEMIKSSFIFKNYFSVVNLGHQFCYTVTVPTHFKVLYDSN